jgi:hypothetical protein
MQLDPSEIVPVMRVISRGLHRRFGRDFYQRAVARLEPLLDSLSRAKAAVYLAARYTY